MERLMRRQNTKATDNSLSLNLKNVPVQQLLAVRRQPWEIVCEALSVDRQMPFTERPALFRNCQHKWPLTGGL